jgi:hypothetical protein
MKETMPKANPDVTLHIPQPLFQAVQTRLTDFLLQSQYAFSQSFSSGLDTTFDIYFDRSPAAAPESVQLVLCQATDGTAITVTQDQARGAALQSAHIAALVGHLMAVCTANEGP